MQDEEFIRTISNGETAIKYLKANETPAYPRNYELWYTYSSGVNRELNTAINAALREHGSLSPAMTDKMYEEFIASQMMSERVGQISGELTGEVSDIIEALAKTGGNVGKFGKELKQATSGLDGVKSEDQLRPVIQSILKATTEMEKQNEELEKQLKESQANIADLQENLEIIRFESLTDQLTGLPNRKRFDEALRSAILEAKEEGTPFCLVIGDVDHFKKFNDTYGHQTGDQVLRLVAATLRNNVKGKDTAARYGGEEFGIVLPGTHLNNALTVANQIREAVKAKELVKRSTNESLGRVTMSFGISLFTPDDTSESMIERADKALYAAKQAGRNRVLTEDDIQAESAVA